MSPTIPAPVKTNDETIGAALLVSEQSDARLAAALWECQQNRYYRILGYRSLEAYLKERWENTEMGGAALIRARSIQRLLREYKLALEIPAFRRAFDQMGRANRRMIAQVLTPENADEWIEAAKSMTARELAQRIRLMAPGDKPEEKQRVVLSLYPGQREIWERTKEAARAVVLRSGGEPERLTDAMIFEQACAELLGSENSFSVELAPGETPAALITCPSCRRVAQLRRVPDNDDVVDGRRALGVVCLQCEAQLVLMNL